MDSLELILSFAGGSLVGAVAGGWLARWSERDKPLRDHMIQASDEFAAAMSAGIAQLVAVGESAAPHTHLQDANEACVRALGQLGGLHVLFAEETYEQAEAAVVELRAAIASSKPAFPAAGYRHLRAFADCAGAEIRRPSGVLRWLTKLKLWKHIERQTGKKRQQGKKRQKGKKRPRSPLTESFSEDRESLEEQETGLESPSR
jgi:hypothetical protein